MGCKEITEVCKKIVEATVLLAGTSGLSRVDFWEMTAMEEREPKCSQYSLCCSQQPPVPVNAKLF